MRSNRLERRLTDHQAAVREFIARATAVPDEHWLLPRAEGKWTPAQETRHLVLTYDALMRDLQRAESMQLRGNRVRRLIWKVIGLSWILWLRRIPRAVRAPREVRPDWEPAPASELLPALLHCAQEFEVVFAEKWSKEPGRRLTHPFFGRITLDDTIRLSTVHIRHHAAFLPPSP